jgi:dTDP-4-amino-4,6-dideoxygalactose transaminase
MEELAILGGPAVRTDPWPHWPVHDQKEEQAVLEVLRSGEWWRQSHGQLLDAAESETEPYSPVARFQRAFARSHDCKYGICTVNGTVSIELALRAAGVRPGDEVIVPAYTFIATATAPLVVGAIPIFVDVDPDTYNIDVRRVEEAITSRTRAIIPVHFGGQPCPMDEILALARKHDLVVIEDSAHAHGASYKGRKCGSIGSLGSFSFQASKNMTAGEGGIITTNSPAYAERCESLVWVGRRKGEPWYRHFEMASNARLTEFQGAILLAQLSRLEEHAARRTASAQLLDSLLGEIDGIRPTALLESTTCHAYHLYMFRYDRRAFAGLPKQKFVQALQAEGIRDATTGYAAPLYANPMFVDKNFLGGGWPVDAWEHGRSLNYADFIERCPVSERACDSEAIWLPQSYLLADSKAMQDVAQAVRKVQASAQRLASA